MAQEAQHTPGPWKYDASSGAIFFADGEVEPLIASTNLEGVSVEQADADGHLIAAAPDMLAALRDIALLKGRHTWTGTSEAYIKALAAVAMDAIAKATQPSA